MKQTIRRLGWMKDYPDIRDYHQNTSTIRKNPLKPDSKKPVKTLLKEMGITNANKKLPIKKVNLSEWCSPIKDQGILGSCTAFAAVGMYEYYQNKVFKEFINGSELFVYKVERNMLNLTGDTGAHNRTAMGALALFGVPPASSYPYQVEKFEEEPPAFVYSYGSNFQALSYYRLDPLGTSGQQALRNIKEHLRAGFPSIMGFTCYTSLFSEEIERTGKIPYPSSTESVRGGHAVMIVGYDDDLVISNPIDKTKKRGALIIRNSWGVDWGNKGYGYIPYEYVKQQLASDFWCMISAEWIDVDDYTQ